MAAAKLAGRPAIWQRLRLLNSIGGACLGTQLASDNLMGQAASLEQRQVVPALNAKAIAIYQAQGTPPVGRVMAEEFGSICEDMLFEIETSSGRGFP
jgi:hypothetical protein